MKPENHDMSVLLTRLTELWPYLSPEQTAWLRLHAQFCVLVHNFSRIPVAIQHGLLTFGFTLVGLAVLPSPLTLPPLILPILWAACYSCALAVVAVLPSDQREMIR